MGRQSRLNRKKKWAVGAVTAALCLADITVPFTAYAADAVSYSTSVSSVPGFDVSNPNYTGSTSSQTSGIPSGAGSGTARTSASQTGSGTGNSGAVTGGPQVIEVTPAEQYYEDYDIYSESINGQYFFYANVSNNGITDQPVSVDFPANMTYTMEKDGVVTEYLSKQPVSDYGTYLFRITVNEDPTKPVSEQKLYKAIFVFRIQPKVERPTETSRESEDGLYGFPEDSSSTSGSSSSSADWDVSGLPDILKETYRPEESQNQEYKNQDDDNSDYVDVSKDIPGETSAGEETETTEETDGDQEKPDADQEKTPEVHETSDGVSTVYVPSRGTYRTEYPDGTYMEVTNPNGMIGNTKIYVSLEGMGTDPEITLLKDGKETDLPEDGAFEEPGNYELLVRIRGNVYPYSFRILNAADSSLDSYTLPEGIELESFSMDGRSMDPEVFQGPDGVIRLDFTKEGSYEVKMTDPDGPDFMASLTIDRTAPEVSMTEVRGGVQFHYNSEEIREIVVKNGKTEESYPQLSGIDKSGTYMVEFYDYAGNMTSISVNIKRQINMATVAAVIMIIGLVALIVVFYKKTQGEMDVK